MRYDDLRGAAAESTTPWGGVRTTLRVPDAVKHAARVLAQELGTTTNDAIIRLAEEGIAASERRRLVEVIARERRQAVAQTGSADTIGFPTPEELRTAMRSGRREL